MVMSRGSMRQQITKGPMKKKVGLYKTGKRVRVVQGNKGRLARNNIRTR